MADDSDTEEALVSSFSTLSEAISFESSNEDLIRTATEVSRRRLAAYNDRNSSDDTVKVLTAFLDHLPLHGKRMVLRLIQEDTSDNKLFALSLHLNTAILILGRSLYYRIKFYSFVF
jgi:hypothetical protein